MALWLVQKTPEKAVRVRALVRNIVLHSWTRYLTLTLPLSTQEYKLGTGELLGKRNKLRGSDLRWTSIPSNGGGGSGNSPSRFMLQKPG